MGYNTVAIILNDRLHELDKDPESGKRIADAARAWTVRDYRPHSTGFRYGDIISQSHADDYQVTVVHRNCGWSIDDDKFDEYLGPLAFQKMKECLERNGYRVAKIRKKAASALELE